MTEQRTDPHTATAILAGGCFWCLEAVFLAMKGVRSVQSGYLGGHEDAPSYERVCSGDTGHAEAVKIEFDPAVVSFDALLEVFFEIHDPTTPNRQGNDIGSQYRRPHQQETAGQRQHHRRQAEVQQQREEGDADQRKDGREARRRGRKAAESPPTAGQRGKYGGNRNAAGVEAWRHGGTPESKTPFAPARRAASMT